MARAWAWDVGTKPRDPLVGGTRAQREKGASLPGSQQHMLQETDGGGVGGVDAQGHRWPEDRAPGSARGLPEERTLSPRADLEEKGPVWSEDGKGRGAPAGMATQQTPGLLVHTGWENGRPTSRPQPGFLEVPLRSCCRADAARSLEGGLCTQNSSTLLSK